MVDESTITAIPALGHDWSTTSTVDKKATCTQNGKESTHCTRCDAVQEGSEQVIPATGHIFGDWEELTAPTCTEKGKLYINDGIGSVGFFARVGANPEITVITLDRQ
jgi:hypothetical protein